MLSAESPAAALQRLQAEVAACNRHLKAARKRAAGQERRADPHLPVCWPTRAVACRLTCLVGADTRPVTDYVRLRCMTRRGTPAHTSRECAEAVESWLSRCTPTERTSWRYPRNPREERLRQLAHDALAEHALMDWVDASNRLKGVAPSTDEVVWHFIRTWPWVGSRNLRNTALWLSRQSARTQAVWATRWRARWGARFGRLRVMPDISPELIREKAMWGAITTPFSRSKSDLKRGVAPTQQ